MKPSVVSDATPDDRTRLERMALTLAFEVNAVAELSDAGSSEVERVLAEARLLECAADAIAPELDADDRVLEFARLVLRLLPAELEAAKARNPSQRRPAR